MARPSPSRTSASVPAGRPDGRGIRPRAARLGRTAAGAGVEGGAEQQGHPAVAVAAQCRSSEPAGSTLR
ncbi:hypothetical protein G6F59_018506 [Rhizopus arrhizus]|nr:hypothetical protein G6F59_018506 [Rhizopus arrhizus]